MRRTLPLIALWLAAGAAATSVAWLGVSSVSDELAGNASHPDPLSAEEIRAEVEAGPSTTTTSGTPNAEPTSTTPPSDPGASTSTTASTVTATPTTTTTRPPAVVSTTRSYDLVGGNVTLRFSPSGVTVVVATPAPGFSVELGNSHDSGAKVEFEGEGHKSQVEGWWDDGPQDEVREDSDD